MEEFAVMKIRFLPSCLFSLSTSPRRLLGTPPRGLLARKGRLAAEARQAPVPDVFVIRFAFGQRYLVPGASTSFDESPAPQRAVVGFRPGPGFPSLLFCVLASYEGVIWERTIHTAMPSRSSSRGRNGQIDKLDFDKNRKAPSANDGSGASSPHGLLRDDESLLSNVVEGIIERDRRKMKRQVMKYLSFASAMVNW